MRFLLIPLVACIVLSAGCAARPRDFNAAAASRADRELEIKLVQAQQSKPQEPARRPAERFAEYAAEARLMNELPPVFYMLNSVPPTEPSASPQWTAAFHLYVRLGYQYDQAELMADRNVGGRKEAPDQPDVIPSTSEPVQFVR